jgi:2-phosphosulfolactate phosphatase
MPVPPEVHRGTGPSALQEALENDHIIILVDVLRASSTIITALANGAQAVIPVPTVEEARRIAATLPHALLAGERAAKPLPGFEYGNSPRNFLSTRIRGQIIILTTSNFTRVLGTPPASATILVGAFLNLEHVSRTTQRLHSLAPRPITVVSAGGFNRPAAEDDIAADHIANRLTHPHDPPSYASADDLARELLVTRHASTLIQLGYEEDIHFCSTPNAYSLTPILYNGAFIPYTGEHKLTTL